MSACRYKRDMSKRSLNSRNVSMPVYRPLAAPANTDQSSSTADEGRSAGWKLRYSSLFCIFSLLQCLRAVARWVPHSLLFEKYICDCWNVSIELLCCCVSFSSGDLFIFLIRVSSFFPYCCVICTLVCSSPHGLYIL